MRVSIFIPMYNSEDFIQDTMDSVLAQTYEDFELVIINDASTDRSRELVEAYDDPRIHLYDNDVNRGLSFTANRGLELIDTEYLIRMDSDDIMHPERVQRQVEFMDAHPELVMSGTEMTNFYTDGKRRRVHLPAKHDQIKAYFFFDNPMMNPTTIIRTKVWKETSIRFKEEQKGNEDYMLFFELSQLYKVGNIKESLLDYRISEGSITQQFLQNMEKYDLSFVTLIKDIFADYQIQLSDEEAFLWRRFCTGRLDMPADTNQLRNITKRLVPNFKGRTIDTDYFNDLFMSYLRVSCYNSNLSVGEYLNIVKNDFSFLKVSYKEVLKYVAKGLLKK